MAKHTTPRDMRDRRGRRPFTMDSNKAKVPQVITTNEEDMYGAPRSEKVLNSGELSFTRDQIPTVTGGASPAMDFADALLRGNPHAERLAAGAMIVPDERSLADKFIMSTYQWAKHFNFNAHQRKKSEHIPAAYRLAMRHARRFQLDNEFTRIATDVSSRTPAEKLLYRLQFATLPYDKVWIEFDLHVKVKAMREFHGATPTVVEGVPRNMGLLIERVDNFMSTITMIGELDDADMKICVPLFSAYIISLDERELTQNVTLNGCTPFALLHRAGKMLEIFKNEELKDNELLVNISKGSLWGYATGGSGLVTGAHDFADRVRAPIFLLQHGDLAFSRFYDFFELAGRNLYTTEMSKMFTAEISEFSGMARWLVTVLAMLNEVPIRSHYVLPTHSIKIGFEKKPALDFHRLTLRVPKIRPVVFVERKLSNVERKHKAHEVMQHWRTYLVDNPCGYEQHQWEYDYDEGYRLCGKCMSFSRLIHEHVRGDPNLGWVRKDYVIKPSRQE